MSQLVIIDVQKSFLVSENICSDILEISKNYSDILYIVDTLHGELSYPNDMWEPY